MSKERIVRATLDEILEKNWRGEVHDDSDAPEGPSLGDAFWKDAVLVPAPERTTIVLPVERALMEWFKETYDDYPARMNDILREHMIAALRRKAG